MSVCTSDERCETCANWVEIPLEGEGDGRIGVCQWAWRLDLVSSTPLFEGIEPDDHCEQWTRREVTDER